MINEDPGEEALWQAAEELDLDDIERTTDEPDGTVEQPSAPFGSAEMPSTSASPEHPDLVGWDRPHDQRTGLPMSHEKVQEGRQTEIRKMKEHGVYEIRPLKDLRGKKIGAK